MSHKITLRVFVLLLALLGGGASQLYSQPLMIEPKRFVLDDKHRMGIANLYNNSEDTVSYSIQWSHLRMLEDGRYQTIDSLTDGDRIADSLVRFFPPTVTLPPHSAQVVRLRFLKPQGLAQAEYRSHLLFSQIDRGDPIEHRLRDTSSKGYQILFRPLWGISVPVIVRTDTAPAVVSIDSFSISPMDTGRNVTFSARLHRHGNQSSYGTLLLKHEATNGEEEQVAIFKNVAVFPPLEVRRLRLSFVVPNNVDLSSGSVTLEYVTGNGAANEHVQAAARLAMR